MGHSLFFPRHLKYVEQIESIADYFQQFQRQYYQRNTQGAGANIRPRYAACHFTQYQPWEIGII